MLIVIMVDVTMMIHMIDYDGCVGCDNDVTMMNYKLFCSHIAEINLMNYILLCSLIAEVNYELNIFVLP